MAAKTARRKPAKPPVKPNGRKGSDTKWEQVYTRLTPEEAQQLRAAAEADERSVMLYLRRLIIRHLAKGR